jgi:hypothetical protein
MDQVQAFADKVWDEMRSHQQYENDARIDAAWVEAIKTVYRAHECPDCKYSVEKGHQS